MYTRAEVDEYLELDARGTLPMGSIQSAALNIIIAVGSQSRMVAASDIEIAASSFNYGRNIAFREQLENPSIDLIRLFLLMTFYMVGACRRHAASMYIGVASMAASTLGLHATEQYSSLPAEESSLR
nr:hypothetical protein CFP56_12160 [Quercus suber]